MMYFLDYTKDSLGDFSVTTKELYGAAINRCLKFEEIKLLSKTGIIFMFVRNC